MNFILKPNKNNIYFIVFCLSFIFKVVYSQPANDIEELKKAHALYWKYKNRLNNDFLKIGIGRGYSIPAGQRHKESPNTVLLGWGDATINLGRYIAVLATEYKLLKENEEWEALEYNKAELYCAIKAIIRLDNNYDTHPILYPQGINTPGFFLRDDITQGFMNTNKEHFYENLSNTNDYPYQNIFWDLSLDDLPYSSDFVELNETDLGQIQGKSPAMSQDQAYQILLGLALVKKLVDNTTLDIDGERYNFPDAEANLNEMARNEANDIICHLSSKEPWLGDTWQLKNPEGDDADYNTPQI